MDYLGLKIRDDDEFVHITSHIDPNLRQKIQRGEYVELEKLIKRNRTSGFDNDRDLALDIVTKDGHTYLTPKTEKGNTIQNVRRWEQAFRVYASIYSEANPTRGTEIWQYVEIINRAALKYTWENVSSYDHQFRRWMSDNPLRSWSKTLTQIWNLELTDSVSKSSGSFGKNASKSGREQVCWKYNRGKCDYGKDCHYPHKCSFCFVKGHPAIACRIRKGENKSSGFQNGKQNGGGGGSTKKDKKESKNQSPVK